MLSDYDTDLTSGIKSNILRAIDRSITNNSKETFLVLNSFVRRVLQLCIKKRSLSHFQEFIFYPAYYYNIAFKKKSENSSLDQIYNLCSELAALHLKEIIWFDIGSNSRSSNELKDKELLNQFYYWASNGFSQLFYNQIRNNDIKQFKNAIEEFGQISDTGNSHNYDLKFKIKKLERENINGINDAEIKIIKHEYLVQKQFETYLRHVLLGIRYWILFLYQVGKINEETTLTLTSQIRLNYVEPENVLNDILFFRDGKVNFYMGWSDWDYTERRPMKVYSPPNPSDWLTTGFIADQIHENRLILNLDELNPEQLENVKYLYEKIKDNVKFFEGNFNKWKKILNVDDLEDLQNKSNHLLTLFAAVKRKRIGLEEKSIASTPLSESAIKNFKQLVGTAWLDQSRINKLFKSIGSIELIKSDDIKLKNIGQRTFFEKAKMMFIDGEYYQMIYGVDSMGGMISRGEDDEFFRSLLKNNPSTIIGSSVLDIISKAIAELKSKEVIPDLIMLAPEFSYRDKALLENKLFKQNTKSLFEIGTFDNIPIISSFSDLLKNRVLICNFKKAFKMRYKTNPDWYDSELTINVIEVDDEEAHRRLLKQPDKWKMTEEGIKLSDDDAIVLIKTSIIIDIWSTLDFEVIDKESYVLGSIIPESVSK